MFAPQALHCGGAHQVPRGPTKVVLDVRFKAHPHLDGGDDTPGRFMLQTREGVRLVRQYRQRWVEVAEEGAF